MTYLASQEVLVDQLINGGSGQKWAMTQSQIISVNLESISDEAKAYARWALQSWEMVADIHFVETASSTMPRSTKANITFTDSDPGAYCTWLGVGSTLTSATINISSDWISDFGEGAGSYAYQTFIHEIGHAIGLNHAGDYDGSSGVAAAYLNDSWQLSVMSYISQSYNQNINASYASLIAPMTSDILAVQKMYGLPKADSATAGNTVWGNQSNLGNFIDQAYSAFLSGDINQIYYGDPLALTIFDLDGQDIINISENHSDNYLSLRGGGFSNIAGGIENLSILEGTLIEDARLGGGNDTVSGNNYDNDIYAGAGNDVLNGNGGRDRIWGGSGADTIDGGRGDDDIYGNSQSDCIKGGLGNDTVNAGKGADIVYLGSGNDVFDDHSQAGPYGADYVQGDGGADTLLSVGGDDTLLGGDGPDFVRSGAGDNFLAGGRHNDTLSGGDGDDIVYGGRGSDICYLGNGDDLFYDEDQQVFGNDLIFGGRGSDTFILLGGNDTIHGGAGADHFDLSRASGNFQIVNFELEQDTILLPAYLENAKLTGFLSSPLGISVQLGDDLYVTLGGIEEDQFELVDFLFA
ncbi:hypothetical protein Q4543_23980 [Salipiger sp. 1_MG-2023]|uniref:M10 family metallopeptidase n=1 Tax=Salipiger sp. 1_MG-2023 TaxID=3062665 RepID=UPI0026E2D8D4|nr:matrixin family metalloprotease [Salipiger sp. 1_MG-2023]MDO6588530.1 hypothetical protein [Salipiger sp. 1_MG-2023]